MKTPTVDSKLTRLTWLVRVGYVLISLGAIMIVLPDLLPVELFAGPHHYYRVVPVEHGWYGKAVLIALGIFLVLIAHEF